MNIERKALEMLSVYFIWAPQYPPVAGDIIPLRSGFSLREYDIVCTKLADMGLVVIVPGSHPGVNYKLTEVGADYMKLQAL